MLHTLEAEVDKNGRVRLMEPIRLSKPCRALVTLLDHCDAATNSLPSSEGSVAAILDYLHATKLPEGTRLTPGEIEAQIQEERNAWD